MLMTTSPTFGVQLSDFGWKYRPLLIFAKDHQSPDFTDALDEFARRKCELNDRDMVVGVIVSQGRSTLDGREISGPEAAAIRREYGITNERFATLLIGKDGGEKLRLHETPDPDTVFALIDSMPMRQREMAANSSDCDEDLR